MARSESPSISVSRRGAPGSDAGCTVVWLRGEHDSETSASLAVTIARAGQFDRADVLIDLSAVTFVDAATIGAIVASRNRLRSRGRSHAVRCPSPPARRVLELCELGDLVHGAPLHPTGASAALGTWVDVVPIEPSGGIDREAGRVAAHLDERRQAGMQAADLHIGAATATVDVDRGGP